MVLTSFFLFRVSIVTLFLVYASIHDIRSRTVPDKIWYIFGVTIPIVFLYAYLLEPSYLLRALPSIILVVGIGAALFILPLFGKMDSLGIIFIGLMLPELILLKIGQSTFFAPLAIVAFLNGLLLSMSGGLENLLKNFKWKLRYGSLYPNISSPKINKILFLFVARRVSIMELRKDTFSMPIQEGNKLLKVRDLFTLWKQSTYNLQKEKHEKRIDVVKKSVDLESDMGIWVQRLLPFFPYILLGLIVILAGEMFGILKILEM